MHHVQRNSIALFLVHIGSCILLLTSGAHAIDGDPINNIRVFQPILRRSPAMGDTSAPADFFGWAAIFHQTEVVNPTDTMDEAARKTRLERCQKCVCVLSSYMCNLYGRKSSVYGMVCMWSWASEHACIVPCDLALILILSLFHNMLCTYVHILGAIFCDFKLKCLFIEV